MNAFANNFGKKLIRIYMIIIAPLNCAMNRLTVYNCIIEIITGLLILLFVYTAINKLLDHARFQMMLSQSSLIKNMAGFISYALPIVELITALFLGIPKYRGWGFRISLSLMIIFTIYLAYMIYFVRDVPCSCGGVIEKLSWKQHLIFNISFTVLCVAGLQLLKNDKLFIAINRSSRTPV